MFQLRDMSIFVVKMDVPTTSKREEFVSLNGAKMKRCSFEGCANNTVVKGGVCVTHGAKRKNAAAMRGVPIKLLMEEFVSRMAPKLSDAATRDVPMEPFEEEYVGRMEQRLNNAASRHVPKVSSREEFVTYIAQKTASTQITTHHKKQSLSFLPICLVS